MYNADETISLLWKSRIYVLESTAMSLLVHNAIE